MIHYKSQDDIISLHCAMHYTLIDNISNYNKKMYKTLSIYSKENISYITDPLFDRLLKYPTAGMAELIKIIHYDDKYPENRNIYLDTSNNSILHVYGCNGWKPISLDLMIYPIICRIFNMMADYYESQILGNDGYTNGYNDVVKRFEKLRYRVRNKDYNLIKFFSEELYNILRQVKN